MNKTIKEFSDLGAQEMREVLASLKPSMQEVLGKEGVVKSRDTRAVMSAKYTSYMVMYADKIHGLKTDSVVEDEAQYIDPAREAAKMAVFGSPDPGSMMVINTGLDNNILLVPNPQAPPPMNRGDVVKKAVSQIVPVLLKIKQLPKPNNRKQSRQYDHTVRPVRKALHRHGITLAEALAAV